MWSLCEQRCGSEIFFSTVAEGFVVVRYDAVSLGNLIQKWRGSVVAWKLWDPITHWRSLLLHPEELNPQQSTSLQEEEDSIQVEISSIWREELCRASRNIFLLRIWRPALTLLWNDVRVGWAARKVRPTDCRRKQAFLAAKVRYRCPAATGNWKDAM